MTSNAEPAAGAAGSGLALVPEAGATDDGDPIDIAGGSRAALAAIRAIPADAGGDELVSLTVAGLRQLAERMFLSGFTMALDVIGAD